MENKFEIVVDDASFDKEVITRSKKVPVVVDFWADWCMPCRMLKPLLESLSKDYKGKFILAKAEVDNNRKHSEKYGVMSIPSVKMFKGGKIVAEFVGAIPEVQARLWLDTNIK